MADILDKTQEAEVVDAIGDAIKCANDGMDPSDAIAKVASDRGMSSNMSRRMAEAYNVSKTLKFLKEAEGETRTQSFPLADSEKVLSIMFPSEVPTPVQEKQGQWEPKGTNYYEERFYDPANAPVRSEPREEVHTWDSRDSDSMYKRAYGVVQRLQQKAEDARVHETDTRSKAVETVTKLAEYFKSTSHEPFDRFESAALQSYGEPVRPLMEIVWGVSGIGKRSEKRASGPSKIIFGDITPYKLLQDAMDKRSEYHAAEESRKSAQLKYEEVNSEVAGFASGGKSASGFFTTVAGNTLANNISKMRNKSESRVPGDITDAVMALKDPEFIAERKTIRTQKMLHDLMRSDDVLKQADPVSIVNAFNEISAIAPMVVDNPGIMRSLLRQSVESGGQLDPLSIKTMQDIDEPIRRREDPHGVLDRVMEHSITTALEPVKPFASGRPGKPGKSGKSDKSSK